MSVEIINRETEVPLVRHVDCDWRMTHIDSIPTLTCDFHLYQCDKCKTITSVRES